MVRMGEHDIISALASGDGGGIFENEVVAYFLSCMLAGKPVLGDSAGIITKVSCQQRNNGWLLDDLVLKTRSGVEEHNWAFSIKSNPQFSQTGAPKDFVDVVWQQYLSGSPPFRRTVDYLGIVVSGLSSQVSQVAGQVHRLVRSMSAKDLENNLDGNPNWPAKPKRRFIESFRCPTGLDAAVSNTETLVGDVLARVFIREMEFSGAGQRAYSEALSNCRDALRSRNLEDAALLWQSLLQVAARLRPQEGSISLDGTDVPRLFEELRASHALERYPYHAADWAILESSSRRLAESIPESLAGTLVLRRQAETAELAKRVEDGTFIAVVGESGTGKTVLAKRFAETGGRNAVLLDAGELDSGDWQLRVASRLRYPLEDLLGAAERADCLLVVDGLERLHSPDGFRTLASLFRAAERASKAWTVIVTCQAGSWKAVLDRLGQANWGAGPWSIVQLGDLAEEDILSVARQLPQLRGVLAQPRLHSILRKIKVLAIFANQLSEGRSLPDTASWVGEADVLEWYWSTVVRRGADATARSQVLQKIGLRQADDSRYELAGRHFESSELRLIQEMTVEGICSEKDERVGFAHDLIGDWSRQRILLSEGLHLPKFLAARPTSPLWSQAVRLHGVHNLEQNGITGWKRLYDQLQAIGGTCPLATEPLLDSLFMAKSSEAVLSEALALLQADGGMLLRAFLGRFLHFGTIPNVGDSGLGDAQSIGLGSLDSFRLPIRAYWLPVLRFLARNADVAVGAACTQVARVADIWLRSTPLNAPMRREAAELALAVNAAVYSSGGAARAYVRDDLNELVWRATLAGIAEKPEEVAELARAACGRGVHVMPHPDSLPDWFDMAAWPGPFVCPASGFRKVCLETDALAPMMAFRPELAEELILACSIDEPPRFDPMDVNSPLDTIELGLAHGIDWNPPFYTRGPFLRFLRESPEHGQRVICRLADFACEWMVRRDEGEGPYNLEIFIGGSEQKYIHTPNSFCWYTGVCGGPDGVVSALMALEQWGHQQTESGEMNEAILLSLLTEARSTPVVGVVTSIAKRNPQLLAGALRPLLALPELLIADSSVAATFEFSSRFLGWDYHTPAWLLEHVRKWHSMRKATPTLELVATGLMLGSEEMATFFADARLAWRERFQDSDGEMPLQIENLVVRFSRQNWFPFIDDKGRRGMELRIPPDVTARRSGGQEELDRLFDWQYFPHRCRKALSANPESLFADPSLLLEKLRTFTLESPPQGLEHRGFSSVDAVLGGVAVLVDRHWDWLASNPEHLAWCSKQLDDCLNAPPSEPSYHGGSRIIAAEGWTWEVFAAHVAARFWMKAPSLRANRKRLSRLLVDEHPAVVETIFSVLANELDLESPDLNRLQAIAIRWAVAKAALGQLPGSEAAEVSHQWCEKEAASFVDAASTAPLCNFDEMVGAVYEELHSLMAGSGGCRLAAVQPDIKVFLAALGKRGTAARQLSGKGTSIAIGQLWAGAMNWTIGILNDGGRRTRVHEYGPSDWEQKVFTEAGRICATSSDDRLAQSLVTSALGLGPKQQGGLNFFLGSFIHEGLRDEPGYPMFVRRWKSLADAAFESPIWKPSEDDGTSHRDRLQEFWEHVLAFDWVSRSSLTKFAAPVVAFMCNRFVGFVGQILPFFDTPDGFMSFMCTDAASPLRLPVLRALASAVEAHPLLMERITERSSDSLATLLVRIWEAHRFEMTERAEVRRDVWAMLGPLLERQNRIAVELARAMEQVGSYG